MMGRFALTESMGRYSLPKQLDHLITWKVKNKETHQAQYHKQRKKQNQYKHRKTTNSLPTPSTHTNTTHTPPPPLPLHSLIGIGWVWVWSWTVRVTIQFPSASSAVVNEIHWCIVTFWVRFPFILLFLFYNTILLLELIAFAMSMRSTALILFELRSCSSQPLRIDVQEWHCHLLTICHSYGRSFPILTWRSKLMCKPCRLW